MNGVHAGFRFYFARIPGFLSFFAAKVLVCIHLSFLSLLDGGLDWIGNDLCLVFLLVMCSPVQAAVD